MVFFAVVLFGSSPPQLSHHITFLAFLLVFLLFSVAGTACLSKLTIERGWNPIRRQLSPCFLTFKEPRNRFQDTNSARLCSLAGRYDKPINTRLLAPIDYLKIPAPKNLASSSRFPNLNYALWVSRLIVSMYVILFS